MTTLFGVSEGVSITNARSSFMQFPEQLAEGQGVIPIIRNGKPVLAIMTWELFESLSETIDILSDSELVEQLRASIAEIAEGKTRSWEDFKAELDL